MLGPRLVAGLGPSGAVLLLASVAALAGGGGVYALSRRWVAPPVSPPAVPPVLADDHWLQCARQLLAVAHSLPIGVITLRHGRISASNELAIRQLQLDASRLAEVDPRQLFDDPAVAEMALAGTLPSPQSLQLRRANGERFRAKFAVHALDLADRGLRVVLFDDQTDRDRLDERLRRQNDELQAMTGRLLSVQEDERRMISRELHDDIGQSITAIKLGAMAIQDDDDATRREETLAEIVAITDQTVAKLRNLSVLLRPPQLDALGLEAALRGQADLLFRAGQPRLDLALTPLPGRPDAEVELACFRIAQEALTNILRHARASRVTLSLAPDPQDRDVLLTVHDDGRGFDPAGRHGLGLITMRERAQQLGGTLEIETGPRGGTSICARLPMHRAPR